MECYYKVGIADSFAAFIFLHRHSTWNIFGFPIQNMQMLIWPPVRLGIRPQLL